MYKQHPHPSITQYSQISFIKRSCVGCESWEKFLHLIIQTRSHLTNNPTQNLKLPIAGCCCCMMVSHNWYFIFLFLSHLPIPIEASDHRAEMCSHNSPEWNSLKLPSSHPNLLLSFKYNWAWNFFFCSQCEFHISLFYYYYEEISREMKTSKR